MNEDWLSDAEVEPLVWTPQRLDKPSAWWGHVPFAFWLVATCRPRLLVELGTHHGVSYVAFCEAVSRLRLATRCYAVDTRSGDPHAGRYAREVYAEFKVFHDKRYSDFSQFARRRFDEARDSFIDGSIDVLHIDGLDTYDSVRDDFDSWRPKLSERAVVLFHGSNEREGNFDVSQLFEKLRRETPSFAFLQSHGLGVLAIGGNPPESIKRLCALPDAEIARVRERFSYCGARWIAENERLDLARDVATLQQDLCKKDSRTRALDEAMTQKDADIEQKDAEILELKGALEQKERDVLALKKAVMATTATIDQRNASIAEKDTAIAKKDVALTDQKRQIAKVEAMLAERDAQQTEQDRILANQSNCIARMQSEIERLAAAIDRAEQIIAHLAERYTTTLEKRSLRKFRHALQVALFRLPVRTSRYKLLRNSVFFDKNFYLLSNPDVKAAGFDAAVHYLQFGGKEGRDPGPHFSEARYRALSPDVAATSLSALEHYETYGRKGGRRLLAPEPRRDQLGPDDGSAGATANMNALYHYESRGRGEGRLLSYQQTAISVCAPSETAKTQGRAIEALDCYRYITCHPELELSRISPLDVSVSVVIPTYNAGSELRPLVRKLLAQKGLKSIEVVIVDSGSTDGTAELSAQLGCNLVRITQSAFSHSYSRNAGADAATGELLVFMVQDAYPIGEYWLFGLARCLFRPQVKEAQLSAVSCAEYSRADSDFFYDSSLKAHYDFIGCSDKDRIGYFRSDDHHSLRSQGTLSDIACAIPHALFDKYRYVGRYAEDLTLGVRLIRDGYLVGMLSSIRVIHSHRRESVYHLRRAFVDMVFLCDIFPDHGLPEHNCLLGTLVCSLVLWKKLEPIDGQDVRSPAKVLEDYIGEVRKMGVPNRFHALGGSNGFGYARLSSWMDGVNRSAIEHHWKFDELSLKSVRQTRMMFIDRLSSLTPFLTTAYPMLDDVVAGELSDAIQKALAMTIGLQLAYCCLRPRSAIEFRQLDELLEELRPIMMAGI